MDPTPPSAEDPAVRRERASLFTAVAAAVPLTVALWLAVFYLLPPIAHVADATARLVFALKCLCVAVLLCFFTGIEAVAHERLFTPAIDPLAHRESHRMQVNLRYLQHTLEQLLLFVPGLLALAAYCPDGRSLRAVAATTATWVVARFAFWVGYHRAPRFRAAGLTGMVQSALVLLYVCCRFGDELAGWPGELAPVLLLGAIEAVLVRSARSPSP